MTPEDKKKLLDTLAAAINNQDPIPDRVRMKCFALIEADVDIEFCNALLQWIDTQNCDAEKPFHQGKILASLCYLIADCLAEENNKHFICRLAEMYSDYIHQSAHAIQHANEAERNPRSKK